MRTTIKDIAEYTGFSITTVSLVLNNKRSKISENTKEAIREAARELGYTPNQLAVGLVKKRTYTLGLIVGDISNSFFSVLAKGVEDACRKAGWTVILCNTQDRHQRDLEAINVLASKGVDGLLYCMSADSDEKKALDSYQLLEKLGIPFVIMDRTLSNRDLESNMVYFDHEAGGYLATKYLLGKGHRKIGCLTGPKNLENSVKRLNGYRQALQEYGVAYDKKLVVEGDYTMASGLAAAERLLKQQITAIFSFNDMMACGLLKSLKKQGLRVPEDISLMGYDDIPFCELLEVPLTTIRQPMYEMGKTAASILMEKVDKKERAPRHVLFQPELVERESVADRA